MPTLLPPLQQHINNHVMVPNTNVAPGATPTSTVNDDNRKVEVPNDSNTTPTNSPTSGKSSSSSSFLYKSSNNNNMHLHSSPKKRVSKACYRCRQSKTRCININGGVCERCINENELCIYSKPPNPSTNSTSNKKNLKETYQQGKIKKLYNQEYINLLENKVAIYETFTKQVFNNFNKLIDSNFLKIDSNMNSVTTTNDESLEQSLENWKQLFENRNDFCTPEIIPTTNNVLTSNPSNVNINQLIYLVLPHNIDLAVKSINYIADENRDPTLVFNTKSTSNLDLNHLQNGYVNRDIFFQNDLHKPVIEQPYSNNNQIPFSNSNDIKNNNSNTDNNKDADGNKVKSARKRRRTIHSGPTDAPPTISAFGSASNMMLPFRSSNTSSANSIQLLGRNDENGLHSLENQHPQLLQSSLNFIAGAHLPLPSTSASSSSSISGMSLQNSQLSNSSRQFSLPLLQPINQHHLQHHHLHHQQQQQQQQQQLHSQTPQNIQSRSMSQLMANGYANIIDNKMTSNVSLGGTSVSSPASPSIPLSPLVTQTLHEQPQMSMSNGASPKAHPTVQNIPHIFPLLNNINEEHTKKEIH